MRTSRTFFEQVPIASVDAIVNGSRKNEEEKQNMDFCLRPMGCRNLIKNEDPQMENDAPPDGSSLPECESEDHEPQSKHSKPQCNDDLQENWREIAERMLLETDSLKLLDLADQLLPGLDINQSPAPPNSTGSAARQIDARSECRHGKDEGAVPQE
jgi:hypothetical protein